jgi:hypothetical protein
MWSKRTAAVTPVRGDLFAIYAESIRSMGGHRSSDFYPAAMLEKISEWTSCFSSSWSHIPRSMHG